MTLCLEMDSPIADTKQLVTARAEPPLLGWHFGSLLSLKDFTFGLQDINTKTIYKHSVTIFTNSYLLLLHVGSLRLAPTPTFSHLYP